MTRDVVDVSNDEPIGTARKSPVCSPVVCASPASSNLVLLERSVPLSELGMTPADERVIEPLMGVAPAVCGLVRAVAPRRARGEKRDTEPEFHRIHPQDLKFSSLSPLRMQVLCPDP